MKIVSITNNHKQAVLEMMQVFYASPAVNTNGSIEIFNNDLTACIENSPYLEGYVFEDERKVLGYAMIAKSFSTEFGKQCVWLEDLYIKKQYRGNGIGSKFITFIRQKYPMAVIRLEVEKENQLAVDVYKKNGFETLPYMEMIKF